MAVRPRKPLLGRPHSSKRERISPDRSGRRLSTTPCVEKWTVRYTPSRGLVAVSTLARNPRASRRLSEGTSASTASASSPLKRSREKDMPFLATVGLSKELSPREGWLAARRVTWLHSPFCDFLGRNRES